MGTSVIDWNNFSIDTVIRGKADNGKRYLEMFLIDYKNLFNETPNAGCNKCISEYLRKFKLKNSVMSNSNYKLKAKYEGISLGDNTSVMVNNRNITDAYAKILLKKHKAEDIFDVFPKGKKEIVASTPTPEPTQDEINDIDTLGETETPEKQD